MNLHQLRHYSATELIAAGVDVRTVAGRLGHGGGGSTTLRAYTAWIAEADQRAMKSPSVRMPPLPVASTLGEVDLIAAVVEDELTSPYRQIAADLRSAMKCGALPAGSLIPTVETLRDRYGVSVGTAHRAIALLNTEGLIVVSRGRRAVVAS